MTKYMIAWTPDDPGRSPGCKVGPHPDLTNWAAPYLMTTGCCYSGFPPADRGDHERWLLQQAFILVMHGVPVREVLEEFHKIDVWRQIRILDYESIESLGHIALGEPPLKSRLPAGADYDLMVGKNGS